MSEVNSLCGYLEGKEASRRSHHSYRQPRRLEVMAAAHLATTEVTSTIRRLDSFTLYETRTMLYLMGTERTKNSYRLLKISRTDPTVRIALITAHFTSYFLPVMGRS